jgi:hypothetical protein
VKLKANDNNCVKLVTFSVIFMVLSSFFILPLQATGISFSLLYSRSWTPGNALCLPGYINFGNFTEDIENQMIMVSDDPTAKDVLTLVSFNGTDLVVEGSRDKDCDMVYSHLDSDFNGDGYTEHLTNEQISKEEKLGTVHMLYNFTRGSFHRLTKLYYYNSGIDYDETCAYDLDNDNDSELILAAWDSINKTENIRIYDFYNDSFHLIASFNQSITSETFLIRNVNFIDYGDFTGDGQKEILTVSLWISQGSSQPTRTFELYKYHNNNQTIQNISSGYVPTQSQQVNFLSNDFDNDGRKEIVIYEDTLNIPKLSLYHVQTNIFDAISIATRQHALDSYSNWYCISLTSYNLDWQEQDELILMEYRINSQGEFLGRFQVYHLNQLQFTSELLHNIIHKSAAYCVGNISGNNMGEIISVFNDYAEEQGGIEIWSARESTTFNFGFTKAIVIVSFFMVSVIIILKKKKDIAHS